MVKQLALVLVLVASAAADPVDTPAWPKDGKIVELTWVVGVDQKNPKDPYGDGFGLPLRPVDLVARVGGVSRTITLPPETGNLTPHNQVMCRTGAYPLERGELAKITFYEGGASGYFVKRAKPDLLEIHHWWMTDGACEDPKTHEMTACPGEDIVRASFHVPADAKIAGGGIVTIEHGKQVPVTCETNMQHFPSNPHPRLPAPY